MTIVPSFMQMETDAQTLLLHASHFITQSSSKQVWSKLHFSNDHLCLSYIKNQNKKQDSSREIKSGLLIL